MNYIKHRTERFLTTHKEIKYEISILSLFFLRKNVLFHADE